MAAKFVIKNAYLNAITYDYCYNLPAEKIKQLPIKYRRMFESNTKVKRFCEKATLDERIKFFNDIGINFGITFFPDKVKSGVALKELLQKHEEERKVAGQKDAATFGVYVVTDRYTSFMLGLMEMSINGDGYIKALDYNKTGYHIKRWDKQLNIPEQNEIFEVYDNANVVSTMALNTGLNFDAAVTLFGLNSIEIKCLLFFYRKKHLYLKRDSLYDCFVGYITKAKVLRAIKKLVLNGFLDKHLDWQTYQYKISSTGIKLVTDFIDRIIKQNNF